MFNATLAVTVSAANRIFLHGRGIDTEAAGDLHVARSARDPQVTGGFDLLRGSLSVLGKRLVFTRGRVRFDRDMTPELDLVAETSAGGVTARISVTGPASHPSFAITSTPSLPEDEILSRVLFQQSSGSLSPFQALELANSVATLSGRGDAFERLLGINSLNISSSASGNGSPVLGIGRAINDRISVGVTTGVRPRPRRPFARLMRDSTILHVGGVNVTLIELTMTRKWTDGPFRPGHMNGVDRQMIVRLQRKENPKRPGGGSWRRYGCYEDGITVGEFLSRVRKADEPQQAALDDLCWDQNQKFIRLESPEHPGRFLY